MAISEPRRSARNLRRRAVVTSLVVALAACGSDAPAPSPARTPPPSWVRSGPASSLAGVLSFARCNHTATLLLDGRVLVAGGAPSIAAARKSLDSVELFEPTSARFRATSSKGVEWRLQAARDRHSATLLDDGTVLFVGGRDADGLAIANAERFDPRTGTSSLVGSMTTPRLAHTATRLPDGTVLVVGGGVAAESSETRSATAELFDPATNTFAALPTSMAAPRRTHTATLLADGRVLLWGGTAIDVFARPEVYEPTTRAFAVATTATVSSTGASATLLADGRVLLLGGFAVSETGSPPTVAGLLFDPTSGEVAPSSFAVPSGNATARLPDGRVLAASDFTGKMRVLDPLSGREESTPAATRRLSTMTLLPDGRALIVGGIGADAAVATVEVFDTAALSLQPRSTKPLEVRSSFKIEPLPSGQVLIAGGAGKRSLELRDDVTRIFSLLPGMLAAPRSGAELLLLPGGDVWLAGGSDSGTKPTTTERVSPESGLVTASVTLASARLDHTVTLLPDGRALVAGGAEMPDCKCSSAEIADPDGVGQPSPLIPMTTFRQGHTATWLPSVGKVLIAGGDLLKKTAELFDPKTGTFSPTSGPMASIRYLHSATALDDGRVLLVGGGVKTAELYDPATGTFSATSNKPLAARHKHAAALLPNGRVLIAGGAEVHNNDGSGQPNTPLTSAELFDPETDEFTPTAGQLRVAGFEHHAAVRNDGRVTIFGGGDRPVQVFDPKTGFFLDETAGVLPCSTNVMAGRPSSCLVTETVRGSALVTGGWSQESAWLSPKGKLSAGPKLAVPREGHTATVLPSGGVAIVGGQSPADVLSSIEVVDPVTDTSKVVGTLATARTHHTTTLLSDGRLLVLGGEDWAGSALGSLELVQVAGTTVSSTKATTPTPRGRHAATLMPDGRVLVVGGVSGDRPVLVVEAFDTKSLAWTALGQANVGERPSVAHLPDGSIAFVGSGGAYLFRAGANEVIPLDTAPGTRLVGLPFGQVLACRDGCRLLGPGGVWTDVGPTTVEPTDGATALGSSSVVFAGHREGQGWSGMASTQPSGAVAPALDPLPVGTSLQMGDTVSLTGGRFTAGSSAAVAAGVPSVTGVATVIFRPLDGAGPARALTVNKVLDNLIEAVVPNTVNVGVGWLYVVVDGVASQARLVSVSRSAAGRACAAATECTTGFCTDGVCCESACQDGCRSCAAARRGAVSGDDGKCLPIENAGTPRFGCEPTEGDVCSPTGTCDGEGACSFPPKSTPCDAVPGGSCSNGVCTAALTCASHADCVLGQRCAVDGRCEAASVVPDAADPGGCAVRPAHSEGSPGSAWWLLLGVGFALGCRRARWLAAPSLAAALTASPAAAQAPAAPSASAPSAGPAPDPKREEARDLLRKGLALHAAGDVEKALDYFLRSKAVFAAKGNTLNAASSLRSLGRLDEALEQYEEAVAGFSATFDDEDKVAVPRAMAELRPLLGVVRVSADVQGVVVVGGRARGTLPLASGLRLMPGEHTLRVIKDGYKTFETRITVRAGETVEVDAKLTPLAASGGLRIEVPALADADVFVDGVRVGVAPWEGTLAPGPHMVSARRGDFGSAPFLATVLQGQTALVRARSGRLSGHRRIVVSPPTAELSLDGVALGKHEWQGELPPGRYEITATELGYLPTKTELVVTEIDEGGALELTLVVDRGHPRWPKAAAGRLRAELFLMAGVGATFHSGANDSCDAETCVSRGLVAGPMGGVAASFEFPFHLSLEAAGGALSLSQSQQRIVARNSSPDVSYRVDDLQRVKGWWLGAGVGHRAALGGHWALRSRLLVGVVFARSADTITAAAQSDGGEERATVDGSGDAVSSTPLFAFPQLGVTRTFGDWDVGGALAAWVVLSRGPALGHGATRVFPNCPADRPSAPGCVGDSSQLTRERSYGVFALFAPQVSLSRSF